jgi:hypothetical protein
VDTPLHVHLGQRDVERLLGARALLQRAGVEAATAHLRNVEGQFADAGHDRLGLEAVGVIDAFDGALMRLGIQKVVAFDLARFIDQDAQGFAGAIQPFASKAAKAASRG